MKAPRASTRTALAVRVAPFLPTPPPTEDAARRRDGEGAGDLPAGLGAIQRSVSVELLEVELALV